jgi:hypothetical protein
VRVALVASVALFALVGGAAASVTAATVRPVDLSPLTVRGARFHAGEHVTVRVIVRGGARVTKAARASAGGAFTVRFASLSLTDCAAYWIRAAGARGSVAAFTILPPPCGAAP